MSRHGRSVVALVVQAWLVCLGAGSSRLGATDADRPRGLAGALAAARFREAWAVSRGQGITVSVLSSSSALVSIVRGAAPSSRVIALDDDAMIDPAPRQPGTARRRGRDVALADEAFARAVDAAVASGARVVLVPLARAAELPETDRAIGRALGRGVVVVAPTGDEGLSHERFPALVPGVVSVAALASEGCLAPRANAGARTLVAAPTVATRDEAGLTASTTSAALVAGAVALAVAWDASLKPADVARAVSSGTVVETRENALGPVWLANDGLSAGSPARLDARGLLERLRPRSRAIALERPRVVPAYAPSGEIAKARVRVVAAGRLPASGVVEVRVAPEASDEASAPPTLRLPFGPLEPGETVDLEGDFQAHALAPARPHRTRAGQALVASPLVATFRAGGVPARAAFLVVPPDQRPPLVRLLAIEAEAGPRVRATLENAAARDENDAFARLVTSDGKVLAERDAPALGEGAEAVLELEKKHGDEGAGPRDVWLDVGRRPPGFRETVDARILLSLDPIDRTTARKVRRR